jgi:hypothetical protein
MFWMPYFIDEERTMHLVKRMATQDTTVWALGLGPTAARMLMLEGACKKPHQCEQVCWGEPDEGSFDEECKGCLDVYETTLKRGFSGSKENAQ